MFTPQPPFDWFPYDLASPKDAYAQGLRRTLAPPPLTSEFVGMASYAPATFHKLLDNGVESDGSSIGDVAPSHRPSQECAMGDASGQPPMAAKSLQTHTPMDPHTRALALAQEHVEELRRRWQNQPPPVSACSVQHIAPHAHNPASGTQGHAHQVKRDIMDEGNNPPHFAQASQNIAVAVMLRRGLPEPVDPQEWEVHQNLQALVEAATV